jgi:16S rRNA (uracil1498-N3)-methyltransferase
MTVTRLVLPATPFEPGEFLVPPMVARHARVARVAPGEPLELLDLDGGVARAKLVRWQAGGCVVWIDAVERERGEPREPVVLGMAILQTASFDLVVEKATELGATCLAPLLCTRVQGREHGRRLARWRRIAAAAVAQCGRSRPPLVRQPQALEDFLDHAQGLRLVADATAGPAVGPMFTGGAGLTVLVGPEGGFEAGELGAARQAGFLGLSLGPRTLRAETAALAALALAQAKVGWIG